MSNLLTIFSPSGESFDGITPANARDLVTHRGWTYEQVVRAATPAPAPAAPPATPAAAPETPPAPVPEKASTTILTTAEEFSEMTEKDQVKAYLAEIFPAFKIDGRASRDKLVAQAVELANGHAIDEVEAEPIEGAE